MSAKDNDVKCEVCDETFMSEYHYNLHINREEPCTLSLARIELLQAENANLKDENANLQSENANLRIEYVNLQIKHINLQKDHANLQKVKDVEDVHNSEQIVKYGRVRYIYPAYHNFRRRNFYAK